MQTAKLKFKILQHIQESQYFFQHLENVMEVVKFLIFFIFVCSFWYM